LPSGELFSQPQDSSQWEALESRITRLLEAVTQLRNANAQIMKENLTLKNQLKGAGDVSNGSSEELNSLRQKYAQAMEDLKKVKANLEKVESLAKDLNLEISNK